MILWVHRCVLVSDTDISSAKCHHSNYGEQLNLPMRKIFGRRVFNTYIHTSLQTLAFKILSAPKNVRVGHRFALKRRPKSSKEPPTRQRCSHERIGTEITPAHILAPPKYSWSGFGCVRRLVWCRSPLDFYRHMRQTPASFRPCDRFYQRSARQSVIVRVARPTAGLLTC